jgi:hypothetical protein
MNRWSVDSMDQALAALEKIPLSDAQKKYLVNLVPRE